MIPPPAEERKRLRVVIVDDEQPARDLLRRMVKREPNFEVVGEAIDADSAVEAIGRLKPDVVFLDVLIPGGSGFEVLSRLDQRDLPIVVFVTAFDHYAVRAFTVNAVDYVLKPFDEERVAETLQRVRQRKGGAEFDPRKILSGILALQRSSYLVRIPVAVERGRTILVPVDEVEWFEADRKFVHLHIGRTKRTIKESISRIAERLDPSRFLRVSRSAIVNVQRIREIQSWYDSDFMLILSSGDKVPSTRGYRDHIKTLLGKDR